MTAHEIGNQTPNSAFFVQGQSFTPSVRGNESVGPPRGFNGQVTLQRLVIDFDSAEVDPPAEIYIYDQLPTTSQAATGADALAVFDLAPQFLLEACLELDPVPNCYEYSRGSNGVTVPFDHRVYAILPRCAAIRNAANEYAGGADLFSPGCPSPGADPIVEGGFDIGFQACFAQYGPTPVADYRFQESLSSSLASAPALIDLGVNIFSLDTVNDESRPALSVDAGTGLRLDVGSLLFAAEYTVVMTINFGSVAEGEQAKLLDFSNLTSDAGIYVAGGATGPSINFLGDSAAAGANSLALAAAGYHQIVISRASEREPNFGDLSDEIRVYVDGELEFSLQAPGDGLISGDGQLHFFRDDQVTANSQNLDLSVVRLQLFDSALEPSQVERLNLLAPLSRDRFENDNLASSARPVEFPDGVDRTFHSDSDVDWIFLDADDETRVDGYLLSSPDADPRFQPIVEFFGPAIFTHPRAQPNQTLGSCGVSAPLEFSHEPGLVRIRNCPSVAIVASDPVDYQFQERYKTDAFSRNRTCTATAYPPPAPGVARIRGTITEQGNGNPVPGVIVLQDGQVAAISNSVGAYQFVVNPGAVVVSLLSETWIAPPVPAMGMEFGDTVVNFAVSSNEQAFTDGFEERLF
ncbi:MAG: hypothetical protein AAF358_05440 [Pseudomonadota bacterium]